MSIYIIDGKRSAIGKFLGSLYEKDASDVCVQVAKNLIEESKVNPNDIDLSIFGNVVSAGLGQGLARKIAINSGVPIEKPAYSLNMVCGSGMQAISNSCNEIKLGKKLVLTGGYEFMSNIPYATDTYLRLGIKYGDFKMVDLMTKDGLHDSFSGVHMGVTAENIAKELNITREAQDRFAFLTQKRALEAVNNKAFSNEIVPVLLKDYRGREFVFDKDEFPRADSTYEKLASLKPAFIKDGSGTVTAGNTSGINDGAAFLLLGSDEYCKANNIKPEIEIVDYVSIGCDPQKMGLGPYYAINEILKNNKLKFTDIDLFEINEAFAAQVLGVFKLLEKEHNVDEKYILDRTNLKGSGLGLGHPLGCSGARIVVTLYHEMLEKDCKYGIASLCVGGGMGVAVLLKKVGK